jgi:subtilisin
MICRRLLVFSLFATVLFGAALPAAAQGNNYIVSFDEGTPRSARAAAAARHGAAVRYNYGIIDAVAVSVPNENAVRGLLGEASVRSITRDFEVHASPATSSNDNASENAHANGKPGGGSGGGGTPPPPPAQIVPLGVKRVLKYVGDPTGSEGAGIGVAVVDTGIDVDHLDLVVDAARRYNAFDGTSNCKDDNGHGTHVSGTIAAQANTRDVVGVAPGVDLYCVKVLNASGSGSWSTVIAGLDWVYNNGSPRAKVVNMSLGGDGSADPTSPLEIAITKLYDEGVVVVVAAGNDPRLDVTQQVPAAYPEVLAIASTTAVDGVNNKCSVKILADTASYFTTDGGGVTISAPGEDSEDTKPGCLLSSVGILSLKLGGGTTRMSGTSMATPHVSGLVARILKTWMEGSHGLTGTQLDVEDVRGYLRTVGADRAGTAPINSPTSSYSYDGSREGVAVIH